VQSRNCVSGGPQVRQDGEVMANGRSKAARLLVVALLWALLVDVISPRAVFAATASEIDSGVRQTLANLYRTNPDASALAKKSKGILVFPNIVKAGLIVGGQYGDGSLLKGGRKAGYYRSVAASYGFQAGAQAFSYVLFFMDNASLSYLNRSDGWEIGTGPSLVVLDKGFAKSMSTTTLQKGVYAFIFNQKGLMGGVGLQGSKITRIHPEA
jgi:lipid-binding SYLF domain-containing protein